MRYGPLLIGVDYEDELLKRNRALVVFIISRSDNKVVKTTIVEREALPEWFVTTKRMYEQYNYRYILASTSIVGEILDLREEKESEKENERKAIDVN